MRNRYFLSALLAFGLFCTQACKNSNDRNTKELERNSQEDDRDNQRNDYSGEAPRQGVTIDTNAMDTAAGY